MIEWDIPYELNSPVGTLLLNTPTTSVFDSTPQSVIYLLDEEKCSATPGPLRITVDDIPQADGGIIHPSFLHGYTVHLAINFWVQNGDSVDARSPACGSDLRVMWDELIYHLRALTSPALEDLFGSACRLIYLPSGYFENRMVDQLQVIEWPVASKATPMTSAEFTLQSAFPYEMDEAEISAPVTGSAAPYTLAGNTQTYPVFIVTATGTLTQFEIANLTTGVSIVYDTILPGAPDISPGDYVEINTFRNTVYLNGSGANLKSGIDVNNSDFFTLEPNVANSLQFTNSGGATCEIKYNRSWAN